jgi:uncharacterized protein (UPF0147 family)
MDLEDVCREIQEACVDQSVPRRVRDVLSKISGELNKGGQDSAVKITSAIYDLDEIANDVNLPVHAKTLLWDIISHLESIKSM